MNILLPTDITAAMIGAGTTLAAVDTAGGEVAWATGASYALKDRRVDGDSVYECVQAITGAPQNTYAPSDQRSRAHWLRYGPTNRMAPFDEYIYTAAKAQGELRYVLTPGFFNGFALYGADADRIEVTLRDQAGGAVLVSQSQELWEQAFGEWEYLFGNLQRTNKYTAAAFPMRPAAQLDIALKRNVPSIYASLGYLAVGQWQALLAPLGRIGGTQYGVEVTPKSYSYFKRNDDGTYVRRQGRTAKQITASVMIDAAQAPFASALLERIQDTPVAIEAASLPRYGHISTVGFVTGSVVSESFGIARVNLKVEGNI